MTYFIVSFSGGKDSTAMLLRLLEEDWQIDDIVWFDSGWEFPQMYRHIKQVEEYIGRKITQLVPRIPFEYLAFHKPLQNKTRVGWGWPSGLRRWCTREKLNMINKHYKRTYQYIGLAIDESYRFKRKGFQEPHKVYPLIEWKMTEEDCLNYCYDRGFHWEGLYTYFDRISCFCCPLKKLNDFRTLRLHFPELWRKMFEMDNDNRNRRFYGKQSLYDLDKRFEKENDLLR